MGNLKGVVVASALCLAGTSPALAVVQNYTNLDGVPTPVTVDGGTQAFTVTVPNTDFPGGSLINEVSISIEFDKTSNVCPDTGDAGNGTFNSEISFVLTNNTTGTNVTLVPTNTYSGGTQPGGGGLTVTVVFDDDFVTNPSGTPTSGNFNPINPLSAFDGQSPSNGPAAIWTLTAGDSVGADPLCFTQYTLTIDAEPPANTVIIADDYAVTDVNTDATFNLTANDTNVTNASLSFPAQFAGTVSGGGTVLTITGIGVYTINNANGNVTFDPVATYTGRVPAVTYQGHDGDVGNLTTGLIQLVVNERSLCTDGDPSVDPVFVMGVVDDIAYVFDLASANTSLATYAGGGGTTGAATVLFNTDTVTLAPGVETSVNGPTSGLNSVGLDTAREKVFFASTGLRTGDTLNDTLLMYDGPTEILYELIGESHAGNLTGDGDGDDDTFNSINYTDVNELAASFGIPTPITAGNELGGAAGEYFGGSYFFGTEGDGTSGNIDQIWRLDLDYANPLPNTNGAVPSITNMQLVHTYTGDTAHDWGDVIVRPNSDGTRTRHRFAT